jgi:hypothetical protein
LQAKNVAAIAKTLQLAMQLYQMIDYLLQCQRRIRQIYLIVSEPTLALWATYQQQKVAWVSETP